MLFDTAVASGNTQKPIGNEIDLHVTKTYGENFSIFGLYGMFQPGDFIKQTLGNAETYNKLQLQAKMTF
jgi:hypothetical protein